MRILLLLSFIYNLNGLYKIYIMKNIFIIPTIAFAAFCGTAFASNGIDNCVAITSVGINRSLVEEYSLQRTVMTVNMSGGQSQSYGSGSTVGSINGGIRANSVSHGTASGGEGGMNVSSVSNSTAAFNANSTARSSAVVNSNAVFDSVSYTHRTTEGYSLLRMRDMLAQNLAQVFSAAGFTPMQLPNIDLTESNVDVSVLSDTFKGCRYFVSVYIGEFNDRIERRDMTDKRVMKATCFTQIYDLSQRKIFDLVKSEIDLNDATREINVNIRGGSYGEELIALCAQKISEDIVSKFRDKVFKPLVVKVAKDGKIYVNRSLPVGSAIEVFREGEKIIDPVSGKVLAVEKEKVGLYRVVQLMEQISVCAAEAGAQPAKVMDTFTAIESTYGESGSRREIAKKNDGMELREKLAMSYEDYKTANAKIAAGKRKIRDSAPLEHAQDFVAAAGTTMAHHVSAEKDRRNGMNMRLEGERMIADGERMLAEIDAVKQQVKHSCEKVSLESADGRSLVCIVLKYELGNVIVLVGDKLYSIKESSLSEDSRLKIQPFKIR